MLLEIMWKLNEFGVQILDLNLKFLFTIVKVEIEWKFKSLLS